MSNLTREISKEALEEFVDKMMSENKLNIPYFPDGIERQLYINAFKILLGLVDEFANKNEIKFLGHKLTFKLEKE
jgi:hypothetical protein